MESTIGDPIELSMSMSMRFVADGNERLGRAGEEEMYKTAPVWKYSECRVRRIKEAEDIVVPI